MHLLEVHLRNWRSYRNVTFNFPAPTKTGRKNVILIGAQNGVGKTSLLIAVYLAMFGREAISLVEGFRSRGVGDEKFLSYKKLMESILHRPAQDDEEPHTLVRLKFALDENTIILTRRWNFRTGGKVRDLESRDGEEVHIELNGKKRAFQTWQEANAKVEEWLFPCNVMPCLFFDGEQAQARVEAAGGRALFDAVKTLYGTGLLEQLAESLKSYIANERSALQRDVGSVRLDELDQKREQLDKLRDELTEIQAKLMAARRTGADAENLRQKIEADLFSLVGDKSADIEEYSNQMAALQAEEQKHRQDLVAGVGQLAGPLGIQRYSAKITVQLKSEQERDRWLILKEEALGKASSIVDDVLPLPAGPKTVPLLTYQQVSDLRQRLEKALERLWSPPPVGCAEDFKFPFLHESDRSALISKIGKILGASDGAQLAQSALGLQRVETQLRDVRIRFDRTRDIQPQLTKLKEDLQAAFATQRTAASSVHVFESQERGLQDQVADLRGAIGQMEGRQQALDPIHRKLDVAQKLRSLVGESIEDLIPLCKGLLEIQCTKHFRAMISDEYGRFDARFNVDSEPILVGPRGQEVMVSSLSGAQKRAFGIAFTLAVADVSNREAPIIIDTPVGNMDSSYRGRVLRYVAEAAPGQVIFLSHDEEIYGQYVDAIGPRVAKKYLVSFEAVEDGAGISTARENQYFT